MIVIPSRERMSAFLVLPAVCIGGAAFPRAYAAPVAGPSKNRFPARPCVAREPVPEELAVDGEGLPLDRDTAAG